MEAVAIDTVWVVTAGCLVLFMQAGFAMLEVGFSRMKNAGAVMAKVLINLCLAFVVFWAIGYAIAFGDGGDFLGRPGGIELGNADGCRRWRTRRSTRTPSGSSRPPSPR